MSLGGLRTIVRLAARESLRHKGRSALIVALIALPVLAMTFLDVLKHTQDLSPDERANRVMGRADAIAVVTPQAHRIRAGGTLTPSASLAV